MATKDNSPGLLSRVARFVRNPTTDWSETDNPSSEPNSGYTRQALKEMIERKRQNDFVRRREFDQLRKLRSRGAATVTPDPADVTSVFQTGAASITEERAVTLKKIDDIEAQMSRQWWKSRQDNPPAGAGAAAQGQPDQPAITFAKTELVGLSQASDSTAGPDFAPTVMGADDGAGAGQADQAGADEREGPISQAFSASQLFAPELGDGVTDPDLEEAAIRFANGDDAGAEAVLLEALQKPQVSADAAKVWISTLYDFYRATGQQGRFERAAIDFAQRFGRQAPPWFSMPDLARKASDEADEKTMPAALAGEPVWASPAHFAVQALDELNLAVANVPSPWFLDWSDLVRLDEAAVGPLGQLFSHWCGAPLQLQFRGADNLKKVLRAQTSAADPHVGQAAWRLRLDALRIMGLQDEFEQAALDYCVTFSVSPPLWHAARCDYVHEARHDPEDRGSQPEISLALEVQEAQIGRNHADTMPMDWVTSVPAATAHLMGDIVGDAEQALARLDLARRGGERLVISCACLMRVDFSAAGSILNWVAQRQTEGYPVQFRDVHRLVGAFFNVIGIHEHAKVILRAN